MHIYIYRLVQPFAIDIYIDLYIYIDIYIYLKRFIYMYN